MQVGLGRKECLIRGLILSSIDLRFYILVTLLTEAHLEVLIPTRDAIC